MQTRHQIWPSNGLALEGIANQSVDLVLTSPPYPMIEMWDDIFHKQNTAIGPAIEEGRAMEAYEMMHQLLDQCWKRINEVIKPGGIACINIGDATRTINHNFQLFNNHSRIIECFAKMGFQSLPSIIWKKPTNSPTKFMGSGMYPPNAYITLEHEYILIFRKGKKRSLLATGPKENRNHSAYFWEERNQWFSDTWEMKGTFQRMKNSHSRDRSGAYPFEVPYRLIQMFSVKGDMVLDPFMGTGTTMFAAMSSQRNSVGFEIDQSLHQQIFDFEPKEKRELLNDFIQNRFNKHLDFVKDRTAAKGKLAFKYRSKYYDFPVITNQERYIFIQYLKHIEKKETGEISVNYYDDPIIDYYSKESLFAMNKSQEEED